MRERPIMLQLKRPHYLDKAAFALKSCPPFLDNKRGVLIHRPRSGVLYNLHHQPHFGIAFWCGQHVSGSGKHWTLLAVPPDGRIVCARCESIAVSNGLPSADELAGRHVHIGKCIAVKTCCEVPQ